MGSQVPGKMPRFKPKGMLERDALADLWKHTLSQIPSIYGRLVYLASLRDPNSGAYRHHGLSAAFGREQSTYALRKSHEQTFLEWLTLPLNAKNADFRLYFQSANTDESPQAVVTYLARGARYTTQAPDAAGPAQREQFQMEIAILLQLLKNDAGDVRLPSSLQPA